MNKLISALEELSLLPQFGNNENSVDAICNKYDISGELKEALVNGNLQYLEGILGKEGKIVCLLVPAKEDDDSNDEQEKEDDDKEEKKDTSNLKVVNF